MSLAAIHHRLQLLDEERVAEPYPKPRRASTITAQAAALRQSIVIARAMELGRALERVRVLQSYVRSRDPAEGAQAERADALAVGHARGYLVRLLLDVHPLAGYESEVDR